jgi:hypothetical protein
MQLWNKILIRSAGFGAGFAVAVCAIVGMWAWYSNRPKPIKPWDKGAVTAEYQYVRPQGDKNNLCFTYVVQNNTDVDYRIEGEEGIEITATLKDTNGLSESGKDITTDYPVFVPAHRRVRFLMTIPYPYPVKADANATHAERKQYNAQVAQYVTDKLANLGGFVLFDSHNRYEIDFPNGWEQDAKEPVSETSNSK